jgi:hypothetical protein
METKLYSIDVTARGIGYEAKIRAGITGAGGVLATGTHENDPAQAILLAAKQLAGEGTMPWHTPGQPQKNCVLCGETMYQDRYEVWCDARTGNPVEVAEMHGALKPMYGTTDIQVSDGFCHAQCGINAGWEVS